MFTKPGRSLLAEPCTGPCDVIHVILESRKPCIHEEENVLKVYFADLNIDLVIAVLFGSLPSGVGTFVGCEFPAFC